MIALLGLLALLQQPVSLQQVQLGTVVRPDTTTVGQHFVATIRVRVPAGAEVRFPARPDSLAQVDSAGVSVRTDSTSDGFTESTMTYVLAAWDTGSQRIGMDSVVVLMDGRERIAPIGSLNVYVRSVLPRDSALRKPKPFRPIVATGGFNWLPWLLAVAALVLAAIIFAVWRRSGHRIGKPLSALQIAQREFARIDALRLVESGESERYAVAMVQVVRTYLSHVVPGVSRAATTRELASVLSDAPVVPSVKALTLLEETDLMKFARATCTAERAVAIGSESRDVVATTSAAIDLEREQAAASVARAKAA
jgi:hypothetical protein